VGLVSSRAEGRRPLYRLEPARLRPFAELQETGGVTTLTMKLAFRDQAGRDHMSAHDGQDDSYDKLEDYLRSLLEHEGAVPA
jgi:hypothetical protein